MWSEKSYIINSFYFVENMENTENLENMAKIGKYISQNLNIFSIGNFHYFMMVFSSGKNFKIAIGKMPLEMPVDFSTNDNMYENPKSECKTSLEKPSISSWLSSIF